MSSKYGEIRPWTAKLAALERRKRIYHRLIIGEKDVIIFVPRFFI